LVRGLKQRSSETLAHSTMVLGRIQKAPYINFRDPQGGRRTERAVAGAARDPGLHARAPREACAPQTAIRTKRAASLRRSMMDGGCTAAC
jgi:hypothetical protein